MNLDVGCGHLEGHRRRDGVGIDLHRGFCDVVADAHHLPFRDNVFQKVYTRNVLEHLHNPMKALVEAKRVLVRNGVLSVTIPIHPNQCVDEFIKMLFGFPTRFIGTIKRLRHWHRHRGEKGFNHVNHIHTKDVSRIFNVKSNAHIGSKHDWFRGRKGKLLNRLGLHSTPSVPDVIHVYAVKET